MPGSAGKENLTSVSEHHPSVLELAFLLGVTPHSKLSGHVEHAWQSRALLVSGHCTVLPLDPTLRPGSLALPGKDLISRSRVANPQRRLWNKPPPGRESLSSLLARSWFVPLNESL